MKFFLLNSKKFIVILSLLAFSVNVNAQCSIISSTNSSSLTCGNSQLSNCGGILYIGNGTDAMTLTMNANLNLTCLGAIRFIVRKDAFIDFSNGNFDLQLAAGSSIEVEFGGQLGATSNCSASDLIKIGDIKVASCTGNNALTNFPDLVASGGYSPIAVTASPSSICNSGSSIITALASGANSYKWYNALGTLLSGTSSTYNTGTISSTTTYYVEAVYPTYTTVRKAVTVTLNNVSSPTIGTITQPTCTLSTGSVVLNGLPATGTWTLTRSGTSSETTTGSGTSTTISGLAFGTYTYTVSNGSCTSAASSAVTIINPDKVWNGSVSTDWNTAANWTPSGVPTSSNCVTIPSTTRSPIISGTNSVAYANNLTILNSGALTVKSSTTLTVTDFVDVDSGFLNFENTASLVQINNVTTKANSGYIDYQRITTARKTDYTYWSSPVSPMTLGELYPDGGTFYSYEVTTAGEDWSFFDADTDMVAGKGYIANQGAEIPSAGSPPSNQLDVTFTGVPNNGHYEINNVIADRSYLLGNPYPSALDADEFLDDNAGVLNGTLYFWTHNTQIGIGVSDPGTGLYAYSGDDYATYNATGGVAATQLDINPATGQPYPGSAPSGSPVPTGKIASGQGFFASTKVGIPATSKIVYDNTMRVGVNGITGNNSQFFKTKNPNGKTANTKVIEKNRIWLNLTNTQGAFKQTLVGYITGATNEYDDRFDGESFDGNEFIDFYSLNQDKNLTIQGRVLPFDENDEVPLGYRTTINGDFTINIAQVDGLLANQAVFLEDKVTNTVTDLKSGNYTFNTAEGTFNDRFVLKYTNKTLSLDTTDKEDGILAFYSNNYKTLIIKNNLAEATVNSVALFNMLGQKIENWDVSESEQTDVQIPIKNMSSGIYVVKIKTTKGESSKKIIVN